MFSKANLPAGTHSSYPNGSTLGNSDSASNPIQCGFAQPKTAGSAASTIIAQSFPCRHRTKQARAGTSRRLRALHARLRMAT